MADVADVCQMQSNSRCVPDAKRMCAGRRFGYSEGCRARAGRPPDFEVQRDTVVPSWVAAMAIAMTFH